MTATSERPGDRARPDAPARPQHAASGRLALLALCGDLVVALDAMAIRAIRRAEEIATRTVGRTAWLLELDDGRVPGWDLGALLGAGATDSAWVIVELPAIPGPIAFRVGRCLMVQALPVCRPIPRALFSQRPGHSRPGAIAAGFATAGITELADHVSGVVIELAQVLGDGELAVLAKLQTEARETALEA